MATPRVDGLTGSIQEATGRRLPDDPPAPGGRYTMANGLARASGGRIAGQQGEATAVERAVVLHGAGRRRAALGDGSAELVRAVARRESDAQLAPPEGLVACETALPCARMFDAASRPQIAAD